MLAVGEPPSGDSGRRRAIEPGDDRRVDDALALGHPAQGIDEDGDVGHPLLEEVAEPARVVGEQPLGVADLQVLAQQHDRGARVGPPDAPGGEEPLVGVRGRHPDVDDRDIGALPLHEPQELLAVRRLTDDLDARVGEQSRET